MPSTEQFANRNRTTLINGAELKQLIKDHLKMDVIPGTTPPRRLRASDNVQRADQAPGIQLVLVQADGPAPASHPLLEGSA